MKNYFIVKIKSVSLRTWIFLAILCLGIFLRTYHFQDWLYFGEDQAHDATITGAAAEGRMPWPLLGADMGNTNFHLGPMYYYFQIISAKIFGNKPYVLAYPDLLFSILSIPLFYFFLKRYFDKNISLAVVGLYSISFYMVRYSRFAWNPNPIPFFVILFIMSLHEFLLKKEKTGWIWILLIGFSMGVGIQLHAMLLIIMPSVSFFVFIFLMKKNWRVWDKFAMIFLIVIVLNIGQIISEINTNYANSKIFISSFLDKSQSGENRFLSNLESNIDCHIQASVHVSSSMGDVDNCAFSYVKLTGENKQSNYDKMMKSGGIGSFIFLLFGLIFSIISYGLLIYNLKNEKDQQKRYLLWLITLYLVLYFVVMNMAIKEAPLRYFVPMAFAPFFFIGFIFQFISRKYPSKKIIIIGLIILFFATTNLITIYSMFKELSIGDRSSYKYVVLGEAEKMIDFIIAKSEPNKEAFLIGKPAYLSNFYRALAYVANERNFNLIRDDNDNKIHAKKPVFYISYSTNNENLTVVGNHETIEGKIFGKIIIYKVMD